MPIQLQELIEVSKERFRQTICPERVKIMSELSAHAGFIDDIQKRENEIKTEFREVIASDKNLKAILVKVEELKQLFIGQTAAKT